VLVFLWPKPELDLIIGTTKAITWTNLPTATGRLEDEAPN
jgi:hypothetical protein